MVFVARHDRASIERPGSMERNMRCGVGHCGHCQLGPKLICRDGPVFRADEMMQLMEVREL
jgi:NAD(P)H-flavin reductase